MKKTITILFIGFLLIGCSSKSPSKNEYNNAPKWVKVPYMKGYITGLGIAPKNQGDDVSLQRSEAMAVARDEIARTIETKVGSFFDKFAESIGTKDKEVFARDVKSKIRNVTKQKLKGARVKNTWMGNSGKLYMLMALESNELLNILKNKESKLYNKDTQFQRFLSERNLKELEKELESYD